MSHVIAHRPSSDAALIPTVVLYDVMRETANRFWGMRDGSGRVGVRQVVPAVCTPIFPSLRAPA